jgi:DNA adenine methylase
VTYLRHSPETSSHTLEPLRPFLKWPGGKRWAAREIAAVVRSALTGTYFEPFLGGGAVFFRLRPARAVLGDINHELITVYSAVRDFPDAVLGALRRLPVTTKDYYRIRESRPRTDTARAARFLYLNRTAFAGIYRLNRRGLFNVPYGGGDRTPAMLWETNILRSAAAALAGAELRESDFQSVIADARRGDVVYCDPTYTVAHDHNGFVRYNERNFSWLDQQRLASAARQAAGRGVTVLVSNAHHRAVKALYMGSEALTLERQSRVSADRTKRRHVKEYLFVLGPLPDGPSDR